MWKCPKCATKVDPSFEVCWQCGTTSDGLEDPTFVVADDAVSLDSPLDLDMPKGDEVLRASLRVANEANTYRAAINRNAVKAGLDFLVETKQIDKVPPVSDIVHDKAP